MEQKKEKESLFAVLTNGIIKENPSLRLVLGTCPTLAVTTLVSNSIGMGVAATFVLICSNVAISALRKVIPDKVRLPAYITIIATFVTLLMMVMEAYIPDLYSALGIYLPLIVVNCIILGRAEMFASKNGVLASALDGLGMGIGFTLTLTLMGTVREVLGAGSWLGFRILPKAMQPIGVLQQPPGGFLVFGMLMALVIYIENKTNHKIKRTVGCEGCKGCAGGEGCPSAKKAENEKGAE